MSEHSPDPGDPPVSSSRGTGRGLSKMSVESTSNAAGSSSRAPAAGAESPLETADDQETNDVAMDGSVSFIGGHELASPEAGPSRLPLSPRSASVDPFNFFPSRAQSPARGDQPQSAPINQIPFDSSTLPDEDDNLSVDATPSAASQSPIPSDAPVAPEHFDPPPLFSKSLDTALASRSSPEAETKTSTALLLPANVTVEGAESGPDSRPAKIDGVHFVDDSSQKGAQRYFVAEQTEEEAFLASADSSKICQNCHRPGHRAQNCTHVICVLCGAEDEHERRDCPHGLVCFGCGGRGHRQSDCPDPASRHSRRKGCVTCGSGDHPATACPSLWRVYCYLTAAQREAELEKRSKLTGWYKEAAGGDVDALFCYNCAGSGHLGDDCPQGRASGAKRLGPTAFSFEMASRGPFRRGQIRTSANHTRFDDAEDDVKLPGAAPGFQGGNAGQKTREKAARRLQEQERSNGYDDEEDYLSGMSTPQHQRGAGNWRGGTPFNRGRGGFSARGRGGTPGGYTPQRPWNSEPRPPLGSSPHTPRSSPFSHAHFMGQANSISFGALSTPGSSPSTARGTNNNANGGKAGSLLKQVLGKGSGLPNNPNAAKGKAGETPKQAKKAAKKEEAEAADAAKKRKDERKKAYAGADLHPTQQSKGKSKSKTRPGSRDRKAEQQAAQPHASQMIFDSPTNEGQQPPSGRKEKKRKREAEEAADLEGGWYQSGKGGGNVANWGDNMPGPSKKKSGGGKAKSKVSGATGSPSGSNKGNKPKQSSKSNKKKAGKASKGQQYVGGY